MINLYKLLNTLEQGMSLFQLNKWKTEGIWYPIFQYKKESNEIQVVTNVFVPDQETYHIQLTGNYLDDEIKDWVTFLEATNGEPPYPVIEISTLGLANFLNEDQGYEMGISMYGHYIACKCLDISSEEEYMNQYTDIRLLTNEIKPC